MTEPSAPAASGRREAARTSILTVDDDPGVSRAVARDLRRRYGDNYRIVRAESGEQALEALREMKLRGDTGRGAAGRLPHAADERPASSSRPRWTSTRPRAGCC